MSREITEFRGEYRFLSNFWPCAVPIGGITYPSSEHAYQAHKTLDHRAREAMAALSTPGDAKRAGKVLDLRTDWERVKKAVMLQVVLVKFMKHADLAKLLVATGDASLQEGNHWHDNFWGVCRCAQPTGQGLSYLGWGVSGCAKHSGQGLNYLGRILETVRFIVRED
jgi:N-glycosidase YbiA